MVLPPGFFFPPSSYSFPAFSIRSSFPSLLLAYWRSPGFFAFLSFHSLFLLRKSRLPSVESDPFIPVTTIRKMTLCTSRLLGEGARSIGGQVLHRGAPAGVGYDAGGLRPFLCIYFVSFQWFSARGGSVLQGASGHVWRHFPPYSLVVGSCWHLGGMGRGCC